MEINCGIFSTVTGDWRRVPRACAACMHTLTLVLFLTAQSPINLVAMDCSGPYSNPTPSPALDAALATVAPRPQCRGLQRETTLRRSAKASFRRTAVVQADVLDVLVPADATPNTRRACEAPGACASAKFFRKL